MNKIDGSWAEDKPVDDMTPVELIGAMTAATVMVHLILLDMHKYPEEKFVNEVQPELSKLNDRYAELADKLGTVLAPLVIEGSTKSFS